jgi:hypothetical protein
MPDAFPAVTVPSGLNAGRNFDSVVHGRSGAGKFIGIHRDVAFFIFNHNRNDFGFEFSARDCAFRALLRNGGKIILIGAGDLVFLGNVFPP